MLLSLSIRTGPFPSNVTERFLGVTFKVYYHCIVGPGLQKGFQEMMNAFYLICGGCLVHDQWHWFQA